LPFEVSWGRSSLTKSIAMCLIAFQYRTFAAAPILLVANREEYYGRPAAPPRIQPGSPRVLCGLDHRAGGTWLGVNEYGLVVAVTNRLSSYPPGEPRSRGLLCRDLLNRANASDAVDVAQRELATGRYAGANFLCADPGNAFLIQHADSSDIVPLSPGLHLFSNTALDDRADARQCFARFELASHFPNSASAFCEVAGRIWRLPADAHGNGGVVLRGEDRGTVSSTILLLAANREESVYRYADGPPDTTGYADLSSLARELFASGRSGQTA